MIDWAARDRAVVLILLGSVIAAVIASSVAVLADRVALGGFSPIDWVNHLLRPGNFTADFASGIENYRYSLFMHVYPILERVLGIPVTVTIYLVVVAEILVLAGAVGYLVRTLLPAQSVAVAVIVVMLVVASGIGTADLSRIALKPVFTGLYYNFADAARLLAIAFAWRRYWLLSALLLAFASATHPLIGLLGAAFIGVLLLTRDGDWRRPRVVGAMALYLLLAGGWIITGIGAGARVTGAQIPSGDWLAYTTALSSHWYPLAYGMLTDFHGQHLLPLLGFVLLFYHYLPRLDLSHAHRRALAWGVGLLLVLTALGVAFTIWLPAPLLVKLNLQRADQLALWIGLAVVVAGLLSDLLQGAWWRRLPASVLLLSPFFSAAVLPMLAVMLLVLPGTVVSLDDRLKASRGALLRALLVLAVLLLSVWYLLFSGVGEDNLVYYQGVRKAWIWGVVLVLAAALVVRFGGPRAGVLAVLLGVTGSAGGWLHEEFEARWRTHAQAVDYRAVQDWARQQTAPDALFCVDPLIHYGWRDYSQRSSFGNMREWLHTSWLYDSNPAYYREGLQRFAELGIDARPYLDARPTSTRMAPFYAAVKARFYALDDAWRRNLAARYGIAYFVMQRADLQDTSLPRVYENAHFVVLAVSRANAKDTP